MSIRDLVNAAQAGPKAFFNKNSTVGDMVTGKVVSAEVRQMTDYDDGKPLTWDDGNPMQQVVVTLATDLRDPSIEGDDGQRRVFVKWYGSDRRALLEALDDAGADDLLPGGTFTAVFTGLGEQKDRKKNPPKLYSYTYVAPSGAAAAIQQAQAAQQPATAPAPAAPSQPPAAAVVADPVATMVQVRQLITFGLSDAQIAASIPGVSVEAAAAIRNLPA